MSLLDCDVDQIGHSITTFPPFPTLSYKFPVMFQNKIFKSDLKKSFAECQEINRSVETAFELFHSPL